MSEKDLLDDLLADIDEGDEGDDDSAGKLPTNEDVQSLHDKLAAVEKEKNGLLQDVKAERRKRQDMSGRLSQLTDTVNGILSTRQSLATDPTTIPDKRSAGIPVEFDDDGDGVIPKDAIAEMLTPYEEEIENLKLQLQQSNSAQDAQREAENIKRSIIGEDERFLTASRKYDSARKWVVDQVTDFAQQNGVQRALTSGEALDYVFDDRLEGEFKAMFPELRLDDVVTAEDSQRHYRNTLSHIADALNQTPDGPPVDSRFQKVLNKPSGLGSTTNAKGGELTIAEKVGSLATEDIMNLTDAQIEALQKALASEEKSDGVRF
jgi:hypothetical protein